MVNFLTTALAAEPVTESGLSEALNSLTPQEAAAAGTVIGVALTTIILLTIAWFVLQIIADWKIFTKAGQAGWKSLIPFYNQYVEYDICWSGSYGLVYAACVFISSMINNNATKSGGMVFLLVVLGVISLVVSVRESFCLAKAFGKGTGFAIALVFLAPIMRLVLGFGSAKYVGNPTK